MNALTRLQFDGWTVDRTSGELSRAGATTRLSQQPLTVLLALADHAGQVVTRETLVQALWPKGIVDFDNSLNGIVRKLRVALGDDSETPKYIETLPRIGYRFVGRMEPASSPVSGPRRGWMLAVAGIVALAGLGAWWFSRPTPPAPPAESALVPRRTTSQRAYEYYLDGIYQRSRRDVNGTPLAIAAFENALREDEGYAEAWAALSGTLLGAAVMEEGPVDALLEKAEAAAARAVTLDAALPDAHAALGQAFTFRRNYAGAETELAKALQLNERSARAWHGVALLRGFQGRADEGLAALRRARELEPTTLHFNMLYGALLYYARSFDESIAHISPLVEAQPGYVDARFTLVRALVAARRANEALPHARKLIEMQPTSSALGLVQAALGERAGALAEVERITVLDRHGGGVMYGIATIHAALGDVDAGCTALARAVDEKALFLGWVRLDPRLDPLRAAPCFAAIRKRIDGGA